MHVISLNENSVNLRFILALLNSRLLDFYHQFLNPEQGEALAEIKKENVGKLPIYNSDKTKQKIFENVLLTTFFFSKKRMRENKSTSMCRTVIWLSSLKK